MSKIWFAISLVGLLACGSGESDSGATGGIADTPPVSATASTGGDVEMVEVEEIAGGQAEADAAEISSCIRLVASAKYEEALPVCLEAASIDADNADVKAALAKAETETAKEAASGAAADALGGLGN
jgi:hypothetical protein